MPFYKWKAYDFNLKYHGGVIESTRYELVVIELSNRELVASSIEEIDYSEYINARTGDTHIAKYERKRRQFTYKPTPVSEPRTNLTNKLKIAAVCAIVALITLVILFSDLQCPRRF